MKQPGSIRRDNRRLRAGKSLFSCLSVVALLCAAAIPLAAQDEKNKKSGSGKEGGSAGLIVSSEASAKEVGLPLYPGAKPHKDDDKDSPAVQLGLWGSSFGFKLVVLKMESGDSPEKVSAFYQKALAKYGKVLNCSAASDARDDKEKSRAANQIHCDDERPEKGGMLFKAGTKERQHIVGIQANGQGSLFQLVYVEARGGDKDKEPI